MDRAFRVLQRGVSAETMRISAFRLQKAALLRQAARTAPLFKAFAGVGVGLGVSQCVLRTKAAAPVRRAGGGEGEASERDGNNSPSSF